MKLFAAALAATLTVSGSVGFAAPGGAALLDGASKRASGWGSSHVVTTTVGPFSSPAVLVIDADARGIPGDRPPLLTVENNGESLNHGRFSTFGDGLVENDAVWRNAVKIEAGQVAHIRASSETTPGKFGKAASEIILTTSVVAAP